MSTLCDPLLRAAIRASLQDANIMENESRLDERLRRQSLARAKVPGDGNCLFHALIRSSALNVTHEQLRAELIMHMIQHREDFQAFVYSDLMEDHGKLQAQLFDEYCVAMSRDRAWVGELFVQSFADRYRRRICIISSTESEPTAGRWRDPRGGSVTGDDVRLAFWCEWHYDAVQPLVEISGRVGGNSSTVENVDDTHKRRRVSENIVGTNADNIDASCVLAGFEQTLLRLDEMKLNDGADLKRKKWMELLNSNVDPLRRLVGENIKAGFVGRACTGKSTLLNLLAGDEVVKVGHGVGSHTGTYTEVMRTRDSKFVVHIHYFDGEVLVRKLEEWFGLLEQFRVDIDELRLCQEPNYANEIEIQLNTLRYALVQLCGSCDSVDAAMAVESLFHNERRSLSRFEFDTGDDARKFVSVVTSAPSFSDANPTQATVEFQDDELDEFASLRERHGVSTAECFLIEKVVVEGPFEQLPMHLTLVDTPGMLGSHPMLRSRVAEAYQECLGWNFFVYVTTLEALRGSDRMVDPIIQNCIKQRTAFQRGKNLLCVTKMPRTRSDDNMYFKIQPQAKRDVSRIAPALGLVADFSGTFCVPILNPDDPSSKIEDVRRLRDDFSIAIDDVITITRRKMAESLSSIEADLSPSPGVRREDAVAFLGAERDDTIESVPDADSQATNDALKELRGVVQLNGNTVKAALRRDGVFHPINIQQTIVMLIRVELLALSKLFYIISSTRHSKVVQLLDKIAGDGKSPWDVSLLSLRARILLQFDKLIDEAMAMVGEVVEIQQYMRLICSVDDANRIDEIRRKWDEHIIVALTQIRGCVLDVYRQRLNAILDTGRQMLLQELNQFYGAIAVTTPGRLSTDLSARPVLRDQSNSAALEHVASMHCGGVFLLRGIQHERELAVHVECRELKTVENRRDVRDCVRQFDCDTLIAALDDAFRFDTTRWAKLQENLKYQLTVTWNETYTVSVNFRTSSNPTARVGRRSFNPDETRRVFDRLGGACYMCGDPCIFAHRKRGEDGAWNIEHILPFAKHKEMDAQGNFAPIHIKCHDGKGTKDLAGWAVNVTGRGTHGVPKICQLLCMSSVFPEVKQEIERMQMAMIKNGLKQKVERVFVNLRHIGPERFELSQALLGVVSLSRDISWILAHQPYYQDTSVGKGSFGTVFKHTFKFPKAGTFALKYVSPVAGCVGVPSMTALLQKVVDELKVFLKVKQLPHVLQLEGLVFGLDDTTLHVGFVTQFAQSSLYQLLRQRPPTLRQKVRMAYQLAVGLSGIHEQQILHRDIKSANVLVMDDQLNVAHCDFGMSHIFSPSSLSAGGHNTTHLHGTRAYMDPVTFGRESFASDIYSFGVLLFELFTNTVPFGDIAWSDETCAEASFARVFVGERDAFPTSVPGDIRSLIEHSWSHDVAQRPQSMTVVAQQLTTALKSSESQ